MSFRPAPLAAALAAPLALLGCAGDPAPEAPTTAAAESPSPSAEPTPESTLPEGAVLRVSATVTSDTGAALHVAQTVYAPTPHDSPDNSAPKAVIDACPGELVATVFTEQNWSFTRVDVEISEDGSWPGSPDVDFTSWLSLHPITFDALAADGALVYDPSVSKSTPDCQRAVFATGAGTGTIYYGTIGGLDDPSLWTAVDYGFYAKLVAGQTPADTGMTVSDCVIETSPLAAELVPEATWLPLSDDTRCVAQTG